MLDQETILRVRSQLGTWYNPTTRERHEIIQTNAEEFKVTIYSGTSYVAPQMIHINVNELSRYLTGLRDRHFAHTKVEYPELQKFFRNGQPVTRATILADFLTSSDTQKTKSKGYADGLEVLLDM